MKAFRDVLDEAKLKDLEYVGKKFTWKYRRQGGFVLERLDRAVANNQWLSQTWAPKFNISTPTLQIIMPLL